ncbi:MAG: hypothetical protein RLZZ206_252 [Cyanobacteriota bacterium]|jgi:hypothetical protein
MAALYALLLTLQWLLALQSFSLTFTAVPLWILARDAGLPQKLRWTVCGLCWLQPVVFNTNRFDFHPEVLGMPLLAILVIAARRQWIWAGLIQRPPLVSKLAKRKDPCWSTGMTKPPEAVTERWRRAEPLQPAAGFC